MQDAALLISIFMIVLSMSCLYCTANFYYKPMTDELRFGALGNNGCLYFIYVLGNEPRYDEFLKALAFTRWIDPIC